LELRPFRKGKKNVRRENYRGALFDQSCLFGPDLFLRGILILQQKQEGVKAVMRYVERGVSRGSDGAKPKEKV